MPGLFLFGLPVFRKTRAADSCGDCMDSANEFDSPDVEKTCAKNS